MKHPSLAVNLSVSHVFNGMGNRMSDLGPDGEDVCRMLRAREGDREAFAALIGRHRGRVEAFLYRLLGDRQRAEDGAQEVFLRLWLARHRYEPRARFTTFLYQVARNYWLNEIRKDRSRPVEIAGVAPDREPGDGLGSGTLARLAAPAAAEPHTVLFASYRRWRIRQAIAELPEGLRLVFVLGHLEGCRLAEIAEILEIPVGTVKSRMHAAVRRLRARLGPEEESMP
jgi:RNA polymerase sigma-70 factor (ECF subfamily)